jgi:hypothetical protein
MTTAPARFPIVAVIGPPSPVFHPLRRWLADALPKGVAGSFRTVHDALASSLFAAQPPDLVVVLREYSDQYPPTDVSLLIGRMIFSRVLCCSTAWCISDGRTHDVWPAACRTELGSATARIMHELQGFLQLQQPLSPIAAAEEVFALHAAAVESVTDAVRTGQSRAVRAFVMSDDISLRSTLQSILNAAGIHAESGSFEVLTNLLILASGPAPPEIMFVDIDSGEFHSEALSKQTIGKTLRIAALTGFPGTPRPQWADELLDKNEFSLQATSLLRRWTA